MFDSENAEEKEDEVDDVDDEEKDVVGNPREAKDDETEGRVEKVADARVDAAVAPRLLHRDTRMR